MYVLKEYLVFDGSSMQTVAADGQHTSYRATAGSFDKFIFIEDYSSIVGWIHGKTELLVSDD